MSTDCFIVGLIASIAILSIGLIAIIRWYLDKP